MKSNSTKPTGETLDTLRRACSGKRFAIAVARFHSDIADKLVDGARRALIECGVEEDAIDVFAVPGCFELPLTCRTLILRRADRSGHTNPRFKATPHRVYAGIVALGAIVRGETPHFDFIASECARGIMNVQLETGAPIGFGVLTTENLAQAEERADPQRGDKGYDAAIAVASVLAVRFSEAIKFAKTRGTGALQAGETLADVAEDSGGPSTAWLRHSARDDRGEANAVISDEVEIPEAKIPELGIPDETEIPGKLEASVEPEPEAWSEPEPMGTPHSQRGGAGVPNERETHEAEEPCELETLVAESQDEQGILRLTSDESGDRGEAQVVEDKTLTCKDCSKPFTFTVSEQQFFAEKGFSNEPQRCKDCRQARRNAGGNGNQAARPSYEAVCAECGVTTTVPFRPRGDRPVYCRTCYAAHAPAPASA